MVDLKEESKRISQSFNELVVSLEEQLAAAQKKREEILEVLHKAVSEGDLSENSAYTTAVDDLTVCTRNMMSLSDSVAKAKSVEEDFDDYQTIGEVILFATVLLKRVHTGEEYIIKVYPTGVSDVDKGIISRDSPIGNAIWHKEKDEEFYLTHRSTGESVLWKIVDVY